MAEKCRKCGEPLRISETQEKKYVFGGEEETILRKLYECTNPDCENFKRYSEPDCKHEFENKDYGKYMFEHCHFCIKCGYFVCVDSSG